MGAPEIVLGAHQEALIVELKKQQMSIREEKEK